MTDDQSQSRPRRTASGVEVQRWGENVIFADFAARSAPGFGRKSRQAEMGRTWAARFLTAGLPGVAERNRLLDGRAIARKRLVLDLQLSDGLVGAQVRARTGEDFSVDIRLPAVDRVELEARLDKLAGTPGAVQAVAAGALTGEIGHLLVAESLADCRFRCDCPDSMAPCRHGVAAILELAEELDRSPERVLELRGLSVSSLRRRSVESPEERTPQLVEAAAEPGDFWGGSTPLPPLPDPDWAPALDDTEQHLLAEALRTVSFTDIEALRGVADIEDCYHHLNEESD